MGNDKLFQKRKKKAEIELQRREGKRLTTTTILIVGEGVTEFNIILEKPRGSAPINVVNHALDYCDKNEDIDYAFCVFDQDEHSTFQTAMDKLKAYKVKSKSVFKAIPSVPCFEIWLIIHFTYSTKSYSRSGAKSPGDNAHDDLLKEFPGYSKTMNDLFSKLNARLDTAITNAKRLSKYNEQTSTINPSTNMHELIDFVHQKVGLLS